MADYPKWVLKHKKKGTYINFKNGKYYLYAAHSERIPGTGKVRRVSDGYLGRITEKDGFIPAKKKLAAPVFVYEYGLSDTILSLCANIRAGLKREFRANSDYVMAGGALSYMHGEVRHEHYSTSWLSMRLPHLDMGKTPTEKQRVGMERARRMIGDVMSAHFGESLDTAITLLPLAKAVRMGDEEIIAEFPYSAAAFFERHGLRFEEARYG